MAINDHTCNIIPQRTTLFITFNWIEYLHLLKTWIYLKTSANKKNALGISLILRWKKCIKTAKLQTRYKKRTIRIRLRSMEVAPKAAGLRTYKVFQHVETLFIQGVCSYSSRPAIGWRYSANLRAWMNKITWIL